MSVCFSTRSSLRGSQRKEREKGGKMSLFSLKKTLSFSSKALSLSFFDMLCFGCRFVFFSSLFVHFFSHWVRSSVGLLSLFFPFKGRSETTSKVCLSLSLTKRAFWKTRSPSRMLRGTQKERGTIISEKEDKLARESRKKKMDWISSHCGTRTAATSRVVASKTKTHENKSVRVVCYLPSAPAGHASKIHSSSVALIYIYICVYILLDLFDKRVRIYICALLCSKTHEDEM